jgi:dUTPase
MSKFPNFKFAITQNVISALPVELEGKTLEARDFLPTRNSKLDTGFDVRCAVPGGVEVCPTEYVKIPLGFRAFCPPGWWLKLVPRSSTFIKDNLHALYGTIDEGFENEMMFVGQFNPSERVIRNSDCIHIPFGKRIAQLVPVERVEMNVEEVSNEVYDTLCKERKGSRGIGGFGSSGSF